VQLSKYIMRASVTHLKQRFGPADFRQILPSMVDQFELGAREKITASIGHLGSGHNHDVKDRHYGLLKNDIPGLTASMRRRMYWFSVEYQKFLGFDGKVPQRLTAYEMWRRSRPENDAFLLRLREAIENAHLTLTLVPANPSSPTPTSSGTDCLPVIPTVERDRPFINQRIPLMDKTNSTNTIPAERRQTRSQTQSVTSATGQGNSSDGSHGVNGNGKRGSEEIRQFTENDKRRKVGDPVAERPIAPVGSGSRRVQPSAESSQGKRKVFEVNVKPHESPRSYNLTFSTVEGSSIFICHGCGDEFATRDKLSNHVQQLDEMSVAAHEKRATKNT